jgi:hypothetical protein
MGGRVSENMPLDRKNGKQKKNREAAAPDAWFQSDKDAIV